jgi:hypothetical protein
MISALQTRILIVVLTIVLMTPSYAAGQTEKQRAKQESHREVPNDPYVESPRDAMGTSPSYRFLAPGIVTTQVNVNGSGQNIVGDAANEPSIALNPLDPNFDQTRFSITMRVATSITIA